MDLVKVDIDELRYRINKFEQCTNKEAYLIMSGNTMSCLESIYQMCIRDRVGEILTILNYFTKVLRKFSLIMLIDMLMNYQEFAL